MDIDEKMQAIDLILRGIEIDAMTTAEYQIASILWPEDYPKPVPKQCEENTAKIAFVQHAENEND